MAWDHIGTKSCARISKHTRPCRDSRSPAALERLTAPTQRSVLGPVIALDAASVISWRASARSYFSHRARNYLTAGRGPFEVRDYAGEVLWLVVRCYHHGQRANIRDDSNSVPSSPPCATSRNDRRTVVHPRSYVGGILGEPARRSRCS